MKKALIFLGCSDLQIPAIKWAKEAGLSIILCDVNPNSPGRAFADEYINIGGDEVERLIKYALTKKDKYNVVSAYCGSDFGLKSVAAINNALNLKGLSNEVVELSLNKAKTKIILEKNGIATPKGILLAASQNFNKEEIPMPLIVKPLDGSGSRGVTYVDQNSNLDDAIIEARLISNDIIIEEAIDGDHIDVSGFFAENKFYPGGQLDRFFSPLPLRYPTWGVQPPKYVNQDDIYKLLEDSCKALGIDWGPVKADIINTKNGPKIIEVTPRFHGDVSTSFVCNHSYEISPIKQWFEWLSNEKLPKKNLFVDHKNISGWAGIFAKKIGKLKNITGLNTLKEIPNFNGYLIRRNQGSEIYSIRDNTAIIGFVFATGSSYSEVQKSLTSIIKNIHVEIEEKK